jgi:uncharacterized protein YbjT (DUF2867 family)
VFTRPGCGTGADSRKKPHRHPSPKLREIVHKDLSHYAEIEADLSGFDACFFSLGVSSAGMKAEEYERITYGITMAAAETLCRLNPQMKFFYVSGAGTDSTEQGRSMWARVKGRTENALLRLPFAAAYMFRPGLIQPMHGPSPATATKNTFSKPGTFAPFSSLPPDDSGATVFWAFGRIPLRYLCRSCDEHE